MQRPSFFVYFVSFVLSGCCVSASGDVFSDAAADAGFAADAVALDALELPDAAAPDLGSLDVAPPDSLSAGNRASPLGTNLEEIRDYSTEWVFLDNFKRSRPWFSSSQSDTRPFDLDAHGWVRSLQQGQTANTMLFSRGQRGQYPPGTYVVLYEGAGTIRYSGNTLRDTAASTPGRDVIHIDAADPMQLGSIMTIAATDPSNYLRNIRVIMPGASCSDEPWLSCSSSADCSPQATCVPFEVSHASLIFHPAFLARVRQYRAIRFMHWMVYDDLQAPGIQTWDARPKLDDARWSINDKGAPIEVMIQLANLLHIDPWLCVPHLADDDYVRQMARLVRDRLDPSLRVYVEHSNEVWNGQYPQARWARQQGVEMYPDVANNPPVAGARFHSHRSVEIFRTWHDVFESGSARVVRVLGSFFANPQLGQVIMDWENAYREADALAVAPYFGIQGAEADQIRGLTPEELLAYLRRVSVPAMASPLRANVSAASERGLELIAYEGGQHLVVPAPGDASLDALYTATNRAVGMGDVYADYLAQWRAGGGTLMVHYTHAAPYSVFGRFGSMEYLDQPLADTPKYRALMRFVAATPCWWTACEQ